MEGSQQPKEAPAGRVRRDEAEELAVEAGRRLARLIGEAEGGTSEAPADPAPEQWAEAPPPTGTRVRVFEQTDEVEPGPADLAATRRLTERVDTLSAELVALGRAMTQALDATNDRLAAVERMLRAPASPPAAPDERGADRLRQKLRQAIEGGAANPWDPRRPPPS